MTMLKCHKAAKCYIAVMEGKMIMMQCNKAATKQQSCYRRSNEHDTMENWLSDYLQFQTDGWTE